MRNNKLAQATEELVVLVADKVLPMELFQDLAMELRAKDTTAVQVLLIHVVISGGASAGLSPARRVSRRAFSGYWEYHIDGALFTAPARADHSGAALFNMKGELLGVGSLIVADALGPGAPTGTG